MASKLALGVWSSEGRGLDRLQRQVDTRHFVVAPPEGAEPEHVLLLLGLGQDDPLTPADADQGTNGEVHQESPSKPVPKTLTNSRRTGRQSAAWWNRSTVENPASSRDAA